MTSVEYIGMDATSQDPQHSLRRFLKLDGGGRSGQLLRILGVGFGIAVGIGNTIGSDILRTPGEVANYLGSGWLIFVVWLLGGIYALLCSSSVTELGCMLPRAGGWYVYSRRAFGEKAGFVVGCCDFTVQSVANATLAVAFAEFVGELLPLLTGHVRLLGTLALASLAILNWMGLKTGSRAQEITSSVKALGLVAVVIAAFTVSVKSGAPALLPDNSFFVHPHSIFLGLMLALQGVVVTYDGWYAPIYFVEEDKDPSKNLPRSMIGTALACISNFSAGECSALSRSLHGPSRWLADTGDGCRHAAFRELWKKDHSADCRGWRDQQRQRRTHVHTTHTFWYVEGRPPAAQRHFRQSRWNSVAGSVSLCHCQHRAGPQREF
jgi:hypothetical protein